MSAVKVEDLLYDNLVETLWNRLFAEGKIELTNKLRKVELQEPGYGTIVMPDEGFSESDATHNLVVDFLDAHNVNIVNVRLITAYIRDAIPE